MANHYGRLGAPMVQPTKDELRQWLAEARAEAREERKARQRAEHKLDTATRKLGELVLEGTITLPPQRLGELVLRMAMHEEKQRDSEHA